MASGTPSELATSEMPVSEVGGEATPAPVPEPDPVQLATFPPYPPYVTEPAPPSVADAIIAGRDLRVQHKSLPRKPLRPAPKPARPSKQFVSIVELPATTRLTLFNGGMTPHWLPTSLSLARGPKATDVKMPKRALRAHARCLRKHGAILTDRLERMAKPLRRNIIYLWREHAYTLPPETIARLRSMLDADEPFKPDQAYEYFVNLKKTKKKVTTTARVNEIKKDMLAMCGEKRFVWARNATVAFARGIQQRLSRPGRYALADGMLRLSNIIMDDICGYMHMRTPSRRCAHPKAKFMMEMSDKVAVWIDEILSESDDRMLMMDFDEDEEVLNPDRAGHEGFADDFLNMMGDGVLLGGPHPAYTKFHGKMLEAFELLTDVMDKKGDENLLTHEKFNQTYREGADTAKFKYTVQEKKCCFDLMEGSNVKALPNRLKRAPDLRATEYSTVVANKINKNLTAAVKDATPPENAPAMKDMVDMCSNYLAQNAEFNKNKGPAFKLLVDSMRTKPNEKLYQKGKAKRTYGQAASELENAKGLDSDYDDPNLSQEIHTKLTNLVENVTPVDLEKEMAETVDACSKLLSQKAVDEIERGPAFDLLVKELNNHGGDPFSEYPALSTKHAAAYTLASAPGLSSVTPDESTAPVFKEALHKAIDATTPKAMKREMNEVIDCCGNYLSAFIRDRGAALQLLLGVMKSKANKTFIKRNNYTMDYKTAAEETENAPTLVPYLPVKDIADEGKQKLTKDMKNATPSALQIPMKTLIQDVSNHLSQPIAMRSGAAGDKYSMNFLAAIKKTMGTKPLFKYKSYGQTYSEAADELQRAGPMESPVDVSQSQQALVEKSTVNLGHEIESELKRGVPTRLAPTIAQGLHPTMGTAAKHLANVGFGKGKTLDYLVGLMKDKGETPLGKLQGYEQSFNDGARRLEVAPTLANNKVDKGAYESVKNKLTALSSEKPDKRYKDLPEIIDESSKFLSAPIPETDAEKRRVLADLMARQEDKIVGEDGIYKMTYEQGGKELIQAPVGVTKAHDEEKKKEMAKRIEGVIPDKKMMNILKEPTQEGAAHITDVIKGRGEAMEVIHDGLKKEKDKEFIEVGNFKKTHEEAAAMLTNAPHFGGQEPSPVIVDKVAHQVSLVQKDVPPDKTMAKEHMEGASKIAAKYIANVATKESGLDAEALKALDESGFNADSEAAAEARRVAAVKGGVSKNITDVAAAAGAAEDVVGAVGAGSGAARAGPGGVGGVGAGGMGPGGVGGVETGSGGVGGVGAGGMGPGGVGGVGAGGTGPGAVGGVGTGPRGVGGVGAGGTGPGGVGGIGTGPGGVGGVGAGGTGPGGVGGVGTGPGGVAGIGAGGTGPGGVGSVGAGGTGGGRVGGVGTGPGGVGGVGAGGTGPGGVGGVGTGPGGAGGVGTGPGGEGGVGAGRVGAGGVGGVGAGGTGPGGVGSVGAGGSSAGRVGGIGAGRMGPGEVGGVSIGAGGVGAGGVGGVGIGAGGVGAGGVSGVGIGAGGVGAGRVSGVGIGAGGVGAGGVGGVGIGARGIGTGGVGAEEAGVDGASGGGFFRLITGGKRSSAGGGSVAGGAGPGGAGYGPGGAGIGPGGAGIGPGGAGIGPSGAGYGPGGAGQGPGSAGYGPGGTGYWPGEREYVPERGMGTETEEQRRRRLAEAEVHRKYEDEERRRLGDKEYYRRQEEKRQRELEAGGLGPTKYRGGALGADYDPEHEAALDILHKELRAHGLEVFYQQPQTSLSHKQASDWLALPYPMRVDKTVRESGDTARLHKKFEKKLSALVAMSTPPELYDSMQDVVIEGARRLSEFFVATNYKALVREALVSEMQKRGNEILTEVDGAAETYFFAAQRIKKSNMMDVEEPCYQIAHQLTKKLEDMIRCRSLARKLTGTMKEHVKDAADFLSAKVTKPDDRIEAYIALLDEMEAAGDSMLIEGDIPKSYKDAAAYLRQLTSFEDQIRRPNRYLQAKTQNKLRTLMSNVPPSGYSPAVMDSVIADSAGLLVSYIMLQGEKTEALKVMVQEMELAGESVLLRHGSIRKSFLEGADILLGKSTDQLSVPSADPVVARKIQIKLNNLMQGRTPEIYEALIDDLIEDVTMYLAVHLLQPQVIKICKCMKNVFVQCELWSDEILRRVARPCCLCSRHVSAQALQDLVPLEHLRISPGSSRAFAPGLEISIKSCPSKMSKPPARPEKLEPEEKNPAPKPTPGGLHDPTTSYLLYSTSYNKMGYDPIKYSPSSSSNSPHASFISSSPTQLSTRSSPLQSLLQDIHSDNINFLQQRNLELQQSLENQDVQHDTSLTYAPSPRSTFFSETSQGSKSCYPYHQYPTTMFSHVKVSEPLVKITQAKSGYSSRTPIISTHQMADWNAMMVSLMWNIQAWRDWIQENVDRALAYQLESNVSRDETADNWATFHRRVSTEGLQWRQYSMFSRQLTARLTLRYKDKQIISPEKGNIKTKTYLECQEDMLKIIDMFNRWTQWLNLVVKETDSLREAAGSEIPLHQMRWNHLKKKVEEYSKDWVKYNLHLKVSWEQKYSAIIADYLPSWKQPGPVWVVSACGAVPSGAVAAGVCDGEVIWVTRTTHKCNVLPAALYPSKHCCMVYAEGAVHHYTKYQVMCNAEVRWVAWRGGSVGERAVRVAAGVHVGRVHYRGDHLLGAVHEPHYRCHVIIFGRPFAFNCYELLMLADEDVQ